MFHPATLPNIFANIFHNPYSQTYFQVPNPQPNVSYDIPHGLSAGRQVFVSGFIKPHVDRFHINLETRNGVALHINPRFSGYGANSVVRNADLGGWGAEETSGPFTFRQNSHFDLAITVLPDRYSVSLNGSHLFDFNHRVAPTEVVRVHVFGDLQLHRIVFTNDHGHHGHGRHHGHHGNEIHSPGLPFATPVLRGPEPGRMIQISGFVPAHSGRFVLNLQNGPQQEPNEIPLHVSVRFNDPNTPQPVVIRTNRSYGSWGSEERTGVSPFHRGQHFDVLILVEHNEFKIAVNGQHFTSFRHRNPLQEANHIGISGDVQIHAVKQF